MHMKDPNAVTRTVAGPVMPVDAPLSPAATALAAASISPNTRRAYAAALAGLDAALLGAPVSDTALAEYLAERHEAGVSPATLGVVVAAVRFTAKASGLPSPAGPATARVMAGARREGAGRGRGQVAGVQWSQADAAAAVAANGGNSIAGLRDAAMIAVASDGMLRVSEIAALQVEDLEADGPDTVRVRRSKTDQDGEGVALYLGPATLRRVREWVDAADIADGPLFRQVRRGGAVQSAGLSARSIRSIFAARCEAAGIEGRISGHSLRVGAAQSLASAGAGLVEMQQAGRWDSPTMPARYARGQLAAKGAVARLRYGKG